MTPQRLATPLHSLQPILHIIYPRSILSYSKGAQGLFVPLRVNGIFTVTTISPSSWLRQCPDRYTIRAGRNLPDKEFRYLRTVIVTAAVYWGFPCVFDKQSPGPLHCGPDYSGRPFSRSYGSILPNSLAMNLSSTLGFSPRLPVSVYGTGTNYLKFRGFSWKPLGALSLCPKTPSTIVFPQAAWICLRSL